LINIRLEEPRDIPRIYRVNELAFRQAGEANLVDALRKSNALTLSMVAES
jgi:predicted N-acetyltransferase YhbS